MRAITDVVMAEIDLSLHVCHGVTGGSVEYAGQVNWAHLPQGFNRKTCSGKATQVCFSMLEIKLHRRR